MNKERTLISIGGTLALMWLGHFIVDMMIGFWAVYKTLAGVDLAIAGLIAGVCPLVGEGLQILFGSLGDKGYRKPLLLLGVGAASGDALLAYTDHPPLLFLCYLLCSIGSGAFHPTAVAIVSSLTQTRKGLFVTIFHSGGALGLGLSHFIFSSWIYRIGGNPLLLMLPAMFLIFWALNKNIPGALPTSSQPGRKYGLSAFKQLFRCPELVTLYCTQVSMQSVMWGTIFLLPDVLTSKGYEPWICYGAGHFFFIIGGALMVVPGGYLSDKYSARSVLLVSQAVGCLLFYFSLFSPQLSETALLISLFGLGAALGIMSPVAVAFGNKIMPSRPGLVSAFLMGMVWCLAEGIGPGGGGLLTKCFSENAPVYALGLIGILFLSGTFFTAHLPNAVYKEFEIEMA